MADSKDTVYCRIRREWVAATPEEGVRQNLLSLLIEGRGFPLASIAVEKGLKQMPHLAMINGNIPDRRADIVCFSTGIHPHHSLYPLLLIECKAVKLTDKMVNQLTGYNHFIRAYFICIANGEEVRTGWHTKEKGYQFIHYLPEYRTLREKIAESLNHTKKPQSQ